MDVDETARGQGAGSRCPRYELQFRGASAISCSEDSAVRRVAGPRAGDRGDRLRLRNVRGLWPRASVDLLDEAEVAGRGCAHRVGEIVGAGVSQLKMHPAESECR